MVFAGLINWFYYFYVARWMTGDATSVMVKWDECHGLRMDKMTTWAIAQTATSPGPFGYPEDLAADNLVGELVTGQLKDCLTTLSRLTERLADNKRVNPSTCNPSRMCLVYTKTGTRSILLPRRVFQAVKEARPVNVPAKKGSKKKGAAGGKKGGSSSSSSSAEAKSKTTSSKKPRVVEIPISS